MVEAMVSSSGPTLSLFESLDSLEVCRQRRGTWCVVCPAFIDVFWCTIIQIGHYVRVLISGTDFSEYYSTCMNDFILDLLDGFTFQY